MLKLTNKHNPSFVLFPVNSNTTAWQPIRLPVLLVVPHARTSIGNGVDGSEVKSLQIYIENAPRDGRVAGQDHINLRFPSQDQYTKTITIAELGERLIDPNSLFYKDKNGSVIEKDDAVDGDTLSYTTTSGVMADVEYLRSADYFDLSDFSIQTEHLANGKYRLIYQCSYNRRIVIKEGVDDIEELACINPGILDTTSYAFPFNHPGDVLEAAYSRTPSQYFTSQSKASDQMIAFYRPLTELLQDIHDEQVFLSTGNLLDTIRSQAIPHLAALLGMPLPYFPGSSDAIRLVVLRNMTRLQKLRGSKKAIVEFIGMLGFFATVTPLWYSTDGKRLIAPEEKLPVAYSSDLITTQTTGQVDILLSGYADSGFGQLSIPLLYEPSSPVSVTAYLVTAGSDLDTSLAALTSEIASNIDDFAAEQVTLTDSGFLETGVSLSNFDLGETLGYCESVVSGTSADLLEASNKPLGQVTFDATTNQLVVSFDRYLDLATCKVYAFAAYTRKSLVIPSSMVDLNSNYIDLTLDPKNGEDIDSRVIDFILDMLEKIKSAHTLLRKTIYTSNLSDTYLVTDLGVGGDVLQRHDTDFGMTQVPPAKAISDPADCATDSPENLGYTKADITYRRRLLKSLLEEYRAWLALNGRSHRAMEPINTNQPDDSGCDYTKYGQDKITSSWLSTAASDIPSDASNQHRPKTIRKSSAVGQSTTKPTACAPPNDYKFKGRVADTLFSQTVLVSRDIVRNVPCIGHGIGVYWVYNQPRKNKPRHPDMLSAMVAAYESGQPSMVDELHYSNRNTLISLASPAYTRPSLDIKKPIQHFPGCRFPTYGNLEETFVSSEYSMRPWDIQSTCGQLQNTLNARIVEVTEGYEELVFDDVPYSVAGNGLLPDILSYDDQSGSEFTPDHVVHKIYTSAPSRPWITEDVVVASSGDIEITEPLFDTAEESTAGYTDSIDGYPAETGFVSFDGADVDLDRGGALADFLDAIGLPLLGQTEGATSLFRYGSGILIGRGDRFNCEFREPDVATMQTVLAIREKVGVSGYQYDGTIKSFMDILGN